jgi:glycosyltransferase involved in cell wall biosynthesis
LFDSQIFCLQRFGGISRYFTSLATELLVMPGVQPLVVAPFHTNDYLTKVPRQLVVGRRVHWGSATKVLTQLASFVPTALCAKRFRPDILHRTYYHACPAALVGCRNVVTLHDMIHEKHPQDFRAGRLLSRMKERVVTTADHVICVSENTRRDLFDSYDIPPERVSVTHLGYENLSALASKKSPSSFRGSIFGADIPYVLYVGKRNEYKNFLGLVRAFAASKWLRDNFKLVCFGGGPWTDSDSSATHEAKISASVYHLDGSDALLADCYRNATLFIYPSLYEGFGIPVLEAMSLDCPVACSNTSSLPEVAGDAAVSFDPHDPDAIRQSLESALGSPALLQELVKRGRRQSSKFSWRKCAQETAEVYRLLMAM